jgi:nucleoside-diphosphate-sugar epimerase
VRVLDPDARLLIIGAGFIGARVAEGARALGASVVECTRHEPPASSEATRSFERLDVVGDPVVRIKSLICEATHVLLSYSSGGGEQDRRSLYVGGGEKILEACEGLELRRIIYCSSTSALPDVDAWLDESCDAWPTTSRGRVQREAEDLMRSGFQRLGQPWFVLRLAGLYGPGRDLGRLCDDDHCTRREMIEALARAEGLPAPKWESAPPPGAEPRGKRVDNRRMKEWFGIPLAHPHHHPSGRK